ncbi:MAG: histidinol-phosphatase [Alphaproteobacteria bacterium]|nr:histidinol-phosphatase [Alphaproteobacteria bacterium]
MTCPAEFVALAERLADAAGPIVRAHFRTPVAVLDKADDSPVTIADREAESAMRRLIEATHPDHGIVGEEHGSRNPQAEWVWVLDPIDGTKAFITGKPSFGTLVALLHRGKPVLGVIDQPILGERWIGAAGRPTTLNGRPVRTRACPELGRAALYATMPEMFIGPDGERWAALTRSVKLVRYGADCYAYALLASGFVDAVVEALLKPYDYCALIPIIEGAGGVMTDWNGLPLGLGSDGRVAAAGDPTLHAQLVRVLGDA